MTEKVWPKAVTMACGVVGWRVVDVVKFRIGQHDVSVVNRQGQKYRFLLEKLGLTYEEAGKVKELAVETGGRKKNSPRRKTGRPATKTAGKGRAVGSVSNPNRRNGMGRK